MVEGHASLSIESYVFQRERLIHLIIEDNVLIGGSAFVGAENTAFVDLIELHIQSIIKAADLLIT